MNKNEQYDMYLKTGFTPIVGSSVGTSFAQNGSFSTKDFFEPKEVVFIDTETNKNIRPKETIKEEKEIKEEIKPTKKRKNTRKSKK